MQKKRRKKNKKTKGLDLETEMERGKLPFVWFAV